MKHSCNYAFVLVCFCCFSACSVFEKAGDKLSNGISKNTKSIGKNMMDGIQESLVDSLAKRKMLVMLDSIILTTGSSASRSLVALRDSLLSDKWNVFTAGLMENVSGKQTKANLIALREEMMGASMQSHIKLLISSAMNEMLNDDVNARIGFIRDELIGAKTGAQLEALRDSLIGPKTNLAIKAIVDTAMTTIAYRMNHDIKDAIGNNASFIQKYAIWLLVALGAIAAIIIFLVWRNRQKYLQMVSVLTTQIQNVQDERTYDSLTSNIKQAALQKGIEKDLNSYLKENNINGKTEWLKRRNKINMN